ncbi:uncharacterized protein JN550_007647 [Neoarthrinium moseri]|uniref:uncharacterized protein n=1 Tax=Neoarthrinium moseri TaxID=1658444 RepID=UPI001FDB9311|nr:uncharacterized protein JN550_007647 [Neoarthrinium moseri]KAI1866259.1 hypothetical protein JN550_007647 [Neoarthrinium moseri]
MAPPTTANDNHKQADAFIAYAHELHNRLRDRKSENQIRQLRAELESQIRAAKSYSLRKSRRYEPLDAAGTDLWNLCTRLNREQDGDSTTSLRQTLTLGRVFAFSLVSLAHGSNNASVPELIRLTRISLKAGRSCIGKLPTSGDGELECALLTLQKAADYNGLLQGQRHGMPDDEVVACKRLEVEYFILRTALSWKEGRLDVAEHMYGKSETLRDDLDPTTAEKLTDTLFEIGRDFLGKNDSPMATKWLERAYEVIGSQELEKLSREATELRLAVCQALVQALLQLGTSESYHRAENIVSYIESELGDKVLVLLLRLEILLKVPGEVFESDAYAKVLRRLYRAASLSDSMFKLVVSHIRKLDDKSPTLACQVLDDFIASHVIPSQRDDWLGRTVLIRVHMSTNQRESIETTEGLQKLLDQVDLGTEQPLAADTSITILTLIWKKLDSNFRQGQLEVCEKLLLCALQRNDVDGAKNIFQTMSEDVQTQQMTLYLGYKLAIRSGDQDMASRCIDLVSSAASNDPKFLYACCVDAQESGNELCLLKALKELANKNEIIKPDVHFPALIRVTIRLQISILAKEDLPSIDSDIIINDLCETFEGVLGVLQRDPRAGDGSKLFSVTELNWFCKNAYNLGISHANDWGLQYVIRMFEVCLLIIEHYPKDLPGQEMGDITLRGLFCNFMVAVAYAALARAQDQIEVQLQNYVNMRKRIRGFDIKLEAHLAHLDNESKEDLQAKLGMLLVFDFEAAISLKAWDDLVVITRKAQTCKSLRSLQAMADYLLRAEKPPMQTLYSALRTIINEIWKLEGFDINKLAKYLRCLTQATLPDKDLSLGLIKETCDYVKRAENTEKPFPKLELEWFATTAFNQGVDYYEAQEDELSKKWISQAFTLAHYHRDGGFLEKALQEHHTRLKWD